MQGLFIGRASVRPSVSPVDRQQQHQAGGLLLSADASRSVAAGAAYVLSIDILCRRSRCVANSGSVMCSDRYHRICRSTASRSPVLTHCGICVPPAVTYLPYRVSGSTLTAVGRSQLLARWPGIHSPILSGIQRAAQTVLEASISNVLVYRSVQLAR